MSDKINIMKLLLAKDKGCTGEYLLQVVAVWTEGGKVWKLLTVVHYEALPGGPIPVDRVHQGFALRKITRSPKVPNHEIQGTQHNTCIK